MTTKYPRGKERNELFKNHMSVGVDGLLAVETACYALKDIVREKRRSEGSRGIPAIATQGSSVFSRTT